MLPLKHIYLGLIASVFLKFFFNFSYLDLLIFFLASVILIDLDHVPQFIIKEKSLNPFKFYTWSRITSDEWDKLSKKEKLKYKKPLFIFHNIETLALLFIFSLWFRIFFVILLGFIFHLICDLAYQHYCNEEKHYKISWIYTIVKNKNKKKFS